MKQRITYVVQNPEEFSPEQLVVNNEGDFGPSFTLKGVHAAKEHRITLSLDELPKELSKVFQQWHELHIRWASPKPYTATPPFTSRVSPGLHVFFTPLDTTPENALCETLRSFVPGDLTNDERPKCSSTNDTSIKLPILSERFSMSASSQYYAYLESLNYFIGRFRESFCRKRMQCYENLRQFSSALYIDIDYDTISRTVVLTAGWPRATGAIEDGWDETITLPSEDATVEIGVLSHEPNSDPEDIQFGGFLTVLGQDERPKATRFQTPTRHYPLLQSSSTATLNPHPLTFTTSFNQPTGLHPTLTLTFPSQHLTPPNPSCKLHTHLTLPSALFIDAYQFSDALFLASKNLKSLRSLAGATDLEAPNWVVQQWGSAALFQLALPPLHHASSNTQGTWNSSIPLHLRYLPASAASHTSVPVPWPVVFWACRAEEGAKQSSNPFDRMHLGYEGLFGPKTRFMHVEPSGASGHIEGAKSDGLVEWIEVPVLDTRWSGWVEGGTVGMVVLAFLGLCWVLFGKTDGRREVEREKKKQ